MVTWQIFSGSLAMAERTLGMSDIFLNWADFIHVHGVITGVVFMSVGGCWGNILEGTVGSDQASASPLVYHLAHLS